MTPVPRSPYTSSLAMVLQRVVHILASGLVLLQLRGAYSMFPPKPKRGNLATGREPRSNHRRRALSTECNEAGLNVYVTSDSSDIYEDRFRQIASAGKGEIRPTLILVGTRLGIDRVTPVYWESLKAVLQSPQSIGIAGCVNPPAQNHTASTDKNGCCQWTSVVIALLRRHSRFLFLLSRPPSHKTCFALPRARGTLHGRGI